MARTVEAIIDEHGSVRLLDNVRLPSARRALVTILDEAPVATSDTTSPADDAAAQPWPVRYELIRTIGSGGMSRVYLARDRQTGSEVCIKELLAQVKRSALQQECRALARLRHPGILRLLNFETRGREPYLVTEYASGVPLRHHMRMQVLAQEPLAALLAQRLFDAVAAAHEESIIHRDLKPENVVVQELTGTLWPKILDFGLAIVDQLDDRDAATGIGLIAGTVQYMAPEQISAEAVTPACDVYAIGQMCHEMLTGKPTFSGPMPQVFNAKIYVDGLSVDAPLFAVGQPFVDVIHSCTRLNPGDRLTAPLAARALASLVPPLPPQGNLVPVNLNFKNRLQERPVGWFDGLGYVDRVSTWYDCRAIDDPESPEACARIACSGGNPNEFGVLMQRIPAWHLAGTSVRLQATIRTEVAHRSGLWLRADSADGQVAFENMHDRPIRGTTGWTDYVVDLDLPASTEWLNYGMVHVGDGAMLVKAVKLLAKSRSGAWISLGLPDTEERTVVARTGDDMT